MKNFTDKKKLREFSTTKPALQQMLMGLARQETQEKRTKEERKKKDLQKQTQNN